MCISPRLLLHAIVVDSHLSAGIRADILHVVRILCFRDKFKILYPIVILVAVLMIDYFSGFCLHEPSMQQVGFAIVCHSVVSRALRTSLFIDGRTIIVKQHVSFSPLF